MLNIKEDMIYLQIVGLSYLKRWYYFAFYLKLANKLELDHQMLVDFLIKKGIWHAKEQTIFQDWRQQYPLVHHLKRQCLFILDELYPSLWKQIPQPPITIFYKGDLSLLHKPAITMVGSRKLSNYGYKIAYDLSKELVANGWITVSGVAKGVDSQVHKAAYQYRNGSTIGIIATGFDQCYPAEHYRLQEIIGQKHLLLSEYLPQQRARKHHFIARNRLLAGMSPATIVVQAAKQSGSLITANYALDYNRTVYAVPGPMTDKQSYGCNQLISAGAIPIISFQELVRDLAQFYFNQGCNFSYLA